MQDLAFYVLLLFIRPLLGGSIIMTCTPAQAIHPHPSIRPSGGWMHLLPGR